MTVFYTNEDVATKTLLSKFADLRVKNIQWNWQPLPKKQLLRRHIGRNLAALNTSSDWIWFTDCDVLFHESCLDSVGTHLNTTNDILIYPAYENVTSLLPDKHPLLNPNIDKAPIKINIADFRKRKLNRATGPYQIVNAEVTREQGYCNHLFLNKKKTHDWVKTYEDTLFRWSLNTKGIAVSIPGVYRIRHQEKGRYQKLSKIRRFFRKNQDLYF